MVGMQDNNLENRLSGSYKSSRIFPINFKNITSWYLSKQVENMLKMFFFFLCKIIMFQRAIVNPMIIISSIVSCIDIYWDVGP